MIRTLMAVLFVTLSVMTGARTALGAPPSPQVKALYNAGEQAYAKGKFEAAIEAFEAAYKLQPLPPLLFSAAAAHRRQYAADNDPSHLRTALSYYKRYLNQVREGGRRVEAAKAVEQLQPLVRDGDGAAPKADRVKVTRLMITTTAEQATIVIDGKPAQAMPFVEKVTPGKHQVTVRATGYKEAKREVMAIQGAVVAFELPLEELPALLLVNSDGGGELQIDGKPRGSLPLDGPLALTAGRHTVAVLSRGAEPHVQQVTLKRGKKHTVDVRLRRTRLRTASYVVMGTGAAGLIAAGVLAGLAFGKQSDAQSILDARATGQQRTEADRLALNGAIDERDQLRQIASVALGTAGLIAVAGLALYILDVPVAPSNLPADENEKRDQTPKFELSGRTASLLVRF